MERIDVYSKSPCVQCNATYKSLDKMGAEYHVHDLEQMPEKAEEFRLEGHMQAPVVEAGGERWSGFRPDKLGDLAIRISNEINET